MQGASTHTRNSGLGTKFAAFQTGINQKNNGVNLVANHPVDVVVSLFPRGRDHNM